MGFQVFDETEIRDAILKKAPILLKSGKRSGHGTAFLQIDGFKFSHFRIPNAHNKGFSQNKARELSRKLKLDEKQYSEFVKCSMKKKAYEKHLLGLKDADIEAEAKLKKEKAEPLEKAGSGSDDSPQ